jgi:hypothetical protein
VTVDPAAPGNPEDPQSFNFYAYTHGDPINFFDPSGLTQCGDLIDTRSGFKVSTIMNSSFENAMLAKLMWHEAGPVQEYDRANLAAFDAEQLMIGTAMKNRLAIAQKTLAVFTLPESPLFMGTLVPTSRRLSCRRQFTRLMDSSNQFLILLGTLY